ncbi:hypothetical protein E2C01_082444 [Portunus trituberculatus]|uniref:Uncharacterized protein n=1 Tax=Portunus trituberculatus TaxID=210409 RepID=A0A5B7J3V2_PORTR|nr:hypothetical protein [Portunus trituberculatus]
MCAFLTDDAEFSLNFHCNDENTLGSPINTHSGLFKQDLRQCQPGFQVTAPVPILLSYLRVALTHALPCPLRYLDPTPTCPKLVAYTFHGDPGLCPRMALRPRVTGETDLKGGELYVCRCVMVWYEHV